MFSKRRIGHLKSMRNMGYLKQVMGKAFGKLYPLRNVEIKIGRDFDCEVQVFDLSISRNQCSMRHGASGWSIVDNGGINGTYLNGTKLLPNLPAPLTNGMVFCLGPPCESKCGFIYLDHINEGTSEDSRNSMEERQGLIPDANDTNADNKRIRTELYTSSPANPGPSFSGSEGQRGLRCGRTGDGSLFDEYTSIIHMQELFRRAKQRRQRTDVDSVEKGPQTCSPTVEKPPCSVGDNEKIVGPSTSDERGSDEQRERLRTNKRCAAYDFNGPVPGLSRYAEKGSLKEQRRPGKSAPHLTPSPATDEQRDSEDASDCSISSLDSLRTRIRKKKQRDSNISSRRNRRRAVSSEMDSDDSSHQPSPEITEKLPIAKRNKSDSCQIRPPSHSQQDANWFEESESLLADNEGELNKLTPRLEKSNEPSSENAISSETSKTLILLKKTNSKLQECLVEVTEDRKKMLGEINEQKKLIEVLQRKQGISQEQLHEVLETELGCNICTEILIKPTTLNCAHTFCEHCITVWKKKKRQCPMCREVITSEKVVMVLDNIINRAFEHLDASYQTKRSETIKSREAAKALLTRPNKSKKSRNRRSRSHLTGFNNFRILSHVNIPEPMRDVIQDEIIALSDDSDMYYTGL